MLVLVCGAGQIGAVVASVLKDCGHKVAGFLDETATPALDLRILLLTLRRVLGSADIVQDRNADHVDDVTTRIPKPAQKSTSM